MSGSERYEILKTVLAGGLTTADAARKLSTTEHTVREWVTETAQRDAARRRRELLEQQAARRSSLAIALAIGSTLFLTLWGTSDIWSARVCRSEQATLFSTLCDLDAR
ncbi:MAG: hypothetical protein U0230_23170 [Polyangiales bacterium]